MANEHNLISLGDRTTSEQREIAKMGGVARRERKRASEVARAILENTINLEDGTEATILEAMLRQQVKLALDGDTKALLSLLRIADELPRGKKQEEQEPIVVNYNGLSAKAIRAMIKLNEL